MLEKWNWRRKMEHPKSYIQKFQGGLCEGVMIQVTVLERQLGSKGGGIGNLCRLSVSEECSVMTACLVPHSADLPGQGVYGDFWRDAGLNHSYDHFKLSKILWFAQSVIFFGRNFISDIPINILPHYHHFLPFNKNIYDRHCENSLHSSPHVILLIAL